MESIPTSEDSSSFMEAAAPPPSPPPPSLEENVLHSAAMSKAELSPESVIGAQDDSDEPLSQDPASEDAPNSSPVRMVSPPSSPAAAPNSSPVRMVSPPSSPAAKRSRKREDYSLYNIDSRIPIPVSTLHRWKSQQHNTPDDEDGETQPVRAQLYVASSSPNSPTVADHHSSSPDSIELHSYQAAAEEDDNYESDDCRELSNDESIQLRSESSESSPVSNQTVQSDDSDLDDLSNSHSPHFDDESLALMPSNMSSRSPTNRSLSSIQSVSGVGDEGDENVFFSDNRSSATDNDISLSEKSFTSDNLSNVNDEDSSGSEDSAQDYLYVGCSKKTSSAVLELLDMYRRNMWTKKSLQDNLKFLISCLPPKNNMPPTLYHLFQYVKKFSPPAKPLEHFYCADQLHSLPGKQGECHVCGSKKISAFYEIPLGEQIKFLFEHRSLATLIESYHASMSTLPDDGSLHDIIHGSEYKRVRDNHKGAFDICLILNTDGISPHKSSKAKLWGLMFTIIEIPPQLRSSYIVVCGIWFDKKFKPDMDMYLKPLVDSLIKIEGEGGITWTHPITGVQHTSKISAPLIVADAPARADVQGIQGHNSKYACNTCEQKTVKLPRPPVEQGQRLIRRKRRFLMLEEPARLRTHNRMVDQGRVALRDNVFVKGLKRLSVIYKSPLLDLSTCVLSEYMHSVLKGVVLQFAMLWFSTRGDWYVGNTQGIDKLLTCDIHPPDFITRLPRSLSDINLWKASELRSWLLYYSLIALRGNMAEKFVQHWTLFVQSIFLLLKESITEDDLTCSEIMLRMFVRDISALYGDDVYVYNVHQMIHLPLYVRRWGPLWATSAFMYETFNGVLSGMLHGSKHQGKELVNQITVAQGVQLLRNHVIQDNQNRNSQMRTLGAPLRNTIITQQEMSCLANEDTNRIMIFGRCSVGKEIFSSKVYDKGMKRNNSFVLCLINDCKVFGRIHFFFTKPDNPDIFCVLSRFNVDHVNIFFHQATMIKIDHIVPVIDSLQFALCNMKNVKRKLIKVGDFLCDRPNTVEVNL